MNVRHDGGLWSPLREGLGFVPDVSGAPARCVSADRWKVTEPSCEGAEVPEDARFQAKP